MARSVFFSFHYDRDSWRVQQVKNMGVLDGQPILSSNDWEEVKKGGDTAIQKWIDDEMSGKSCLVILAGAKTAGRKWVEYEIKKAWGAKKGVVVVYIHNLKNYAEEQDTKGANPLTGWTLCDGAKNLSSVAKAYDPPYSTSSNVYAHIKDHLEEWVDEAIDIRKNFKC